MNYFIVASMFAQIAIDPDKAAPYGIAGIVLLWFMFRLERIIGKHTSTINDLVATIALDILSRDNLHPVARAQTSQILARATSRAQPASPQDSQVQ